MKTSYVLNNGIKTNLIDFEKNDFGEIVLEPTQYTNMVIDSSLTLDKESMKIFSYDTDGDENDLSLSFKDFEGNVFTVILKDITISLATNPTEAPLYSIFDMNTNNEILSLATLDDLEAAAAGGENSSDASRFNQLSDQLNQFIADNGLARADIPGQPNINAPEPPNYGRSISFAGDVSFEISEDYGQQLEYDGIVPDNGIEIYSGVITNNDPHYGSLPFISKTIVNDYGLFTILQNGNWAFAFDYNNPQAQELDAGDVINEAFNIEVAGQYASFDIVLTIKGLNDQPEVQNITIGVPDVYDNDEEFEVAQYNNPTLIYESSLENFNQNEDSKFNNSDFEVPNLEGYDIDANSSLTYYIEPNSTTVVDASNTVVDIQASDITVVVDETTGSFSVYSEKLDNLAYGESVKISFNYVADDGLGFTGDTSLDDVTNEDSVSSPATVTLMVTGTNDKPIVVDDCARELSINNDNLDPTGVIITAIDAHGNTQNPDFTSSGIGIKTHRYGSYDIQEGGRYHEDEKVRFEFDAIYSQTNIVLSRFDSNDVAQYELYLDGQLVHTGTSYLSYDPTIKTEGILFDEIIITAVDSDQHHGYSNFRIESINVSYLTIKENNTLLINVLNNDYDNDTADTIIIYDHDYIPETDSSINIVNNKLEFNPGTEFDYLALGESVQVSFNYRVDDQRGFTEIGDALNEASISDWARVKILVVGTNDRPVALDDTTKILSVNGEDYSPTGVTISGINFFGNSVAVEETGAGLGVKSFHHNSKDIQGNLLAQESIKFEYDTIYSNADIKLSRIDSSDKIQYSALLDGVEVSTGVVVGVNTININTLFDTIIIKALDDDVFLRQTDFRIKSIDVSYLTTEENSNLIIDVLNNDYDLDNTDIISINSYDSTTSHGGVVSELNGKLIFNPNSDFDYLGVGESKLITFTYDVKDDSGASNDISNRATVTLRVIGTNDTPVAINDGPISTLFDVNNTQGVTLSAYYGGNEVPTNVDVVNGAWGIKTSRYDSSQIDGLGPDETIVFTFDNAFNAATITLKYMGSNDDAVYRAYNSTGGLVATGTTDNSTFNIIANDIVKIELSVTESNDDYYVESIETFSSIMTGENQTIVIDVLANDYDLDVNDTISINSYDTTTSHGGTITEVAGKLQFDPGTDFDYLAEGETQVVTFTYDIKDDSGAQNDTSAPATVTILVKGANDPANITVEQGDNDSGYVTEDVNPNLAGFISTTGTLSISDPDIGEDKFDTTVTTTGTVLGVLTIDENGNWAYEIDNTLTTVQSLEEYDPNDVTTYFTEIFTVKSLDGTDSQEIVITIKGASDNTPPTISTTTLEVVEDSMTGAYVGQVVASDTETPAGLAYSFNGTGGNYDLFDINVNTGVITYALNPPTNLDYETTTFYDLDVKVTDENGLGLDDVQTVRINILDLDEAITGGNTVIISEDQATNTSNGQGPEHEQSIFINLEAQAGQDLTIAFTYNELGNSSITDIFLFDQNNNLIGQVNGIVSIPGQNSIDIDFTVPDTLTDEVIQVLFQGDNASYNIPGYTVTYNSTSDEILTLENVDTLDGDNINMVQLLSNLEDMNPDGKPDSLDEINMLDGQHIISNLTLQDVFEITDSDNTLRIVGDELNGVKDKIDLDSNWSVDINDSTIYTATYNDGLTNHVLTLLIENDIEVI